MSTAPGSTLSGNLIRFNTADYFGAIGLATNAPVINNVIADNRANTYGSAMWVAASAPPLMHNTFARNTGGDDVALYVDEAYVVMTNTVFVSHTLAITVAAGSTVMLQGRTLDWGNTTLHDGGG
jgi:hypothetical protein